VNLLLRALRAICNIWSDYGEDLFADELLAYEEWNARYKVEEQANEKQERKCKDCFGRQIRHLNTRFKSMCVYSPLKEISVHSCH